MSQNATFCLSKTTLPHLASYMWHTVLELITQIICSFILSSGLEQVYSLFQKEFSTNAI